MSQFCVKKSINVLSITFPEETFAGLNTFYYVLIAKRDCYEFFEMYI